jgi:hypothetical protein
MKKQTWIIAVLLLLIAGAFVVYSQYNKPHTDYAAQAASVSYTSDALLDEFRADAAAAAEKVNNQVIEVEGTITAIEADVFILDNGVVCKFSAQPGGHLEDYAPGTSVKLKGRFVSFDDLLEEVRLDFCVLVY